MDFGGALRIQRLEGSRPHGRLCTLNGYEELQRFKEAVEVDMLNGFESQLERRSVTVGHHAEVEETAWRAVFTS
jgi:hypothetical protein